MHGSSSARSDASGDANRPNRDALLYGETSKLQPVDAGFANREIDVELFHDA